MRPPRFPWPAERTQALIRFWEADLSFSKIADRLTEMFGQDITRNAVATQLKQLDLTRGKTGKWKHPQGAAARPASPPQNTRKKPGRDRFLPVRATETQPAPATALLPEPPIVPLPLMARKRHQCGWPVNDGGPFLFCGLPKTPGHSNYCGYHRLLSLPPELRRRRQQEAA